VCHPTGAHWRHLANTIELVLPSAHSSPQTKRQTDRFCHFGTAHDRVSSGMPGHVLSPNNCLFAWGIWVHILHASLGPAESITQTASRSVQPFLHSSRQCRRACRSMSFPLKIAPFCAGSVPHLISGFLGPQTQHPKRKLNRFSVFAQLTA